ncbi:MAG: pilus assembly protein TadG-related protein, partial [Hyphomicrobiaceae bacterium]
MKQKSLLVRFKEDTRGVTAILFVLSLFAVIGAVGLSIDGARVYGAQQRLQSSVDAAALAAARTAALGGTTAEVEATFNAYLESQLVNEPDLKVTNINIVPESRTVTADVDGTVKATIMQVMGFDVMNLNVGATVQFGLNRIEVALALDNTGSMSGSKLDALKDSAKRLVDTLMDRSPEPGAVRFSLVPFAQYVNVGVDKRGASWLSVPADYSEQENWCRDVSPVLSKSNCRNETYTYYNDGVPQTGTQEVCDYTYGEPVYTCTPVTNTYTWKGCVGSRNYPENVQDSSYSTPIPGLMNTDCSNTIQPLTDDRSLLQSAISNMNASGETYIPAGVMWGLRTLTKQAPYDESAGVSKSANGEPIKKFLIIMTDGANTKSPKYPKHNGTDATLANTLTNESCDAAKAANVRVFTIAFDVTDTTIKNVLRSCAT